MASLELTDVAVQVLGADMMKMGNGVSGTPARTLSVLPYGVKSISGVSRWANAASRSAAWSATSSEMISDGVCM